MAKIKINKKKCKGCLLCINFCPRGLIKKAKSLNFYGISPVEFYDDGTCLGCKQCLLICPDSCIEVYK